MWWRRQTPHHQVPKTPVELRSKSLANIQQHHPEDAGSVDRKIGFAFFRWIASRTFLAGKKLLTRFAAVPIRITGSLPAS